MEQSSQIRLSARAAVPGVANTLGSFRAVPSGTALGAEIQGVDFSLPVPEDVKEALRKAWADHMALVFRGQRLTDDHLLAASGVFGPPHDAASRKYHLNVGHAVDDSYMVSKHPSVTIISNLVDP
jgi:taurine dioxygenase